MSLAIRPPIDRQSTARRPPVDRHLGQVQGEMIERRSGAQDRRYSAPGLLCIILEGNGCLFMCLGVGKGFNVPLGVGETTALFIFCLA